MAIALSPYAKMETTNMTTSTSFCAGQRPTGDNGKACISLREIVPDTSEETSKKEFRSRSTEWLPRQSYFSASPQGV